MSKTTESRKLMVSLKTIKSANSRILSGDQRFNRYEPLIAEMASVPAEDIKAAFKIAARKVSRDR